MMNITVTQINGMPITVNAETPAPIVLNMALPGVQGPQGLQGEPGPQGVQGNTGADGVGVPIGGTTGQVLKKKSGIDYDTEWGDNPSYTKLEIDGMIGDIESILTAVGV